MEEERNDLSARLNIGKDYDLLPGHLCNMHCHWFSPEIRKAYGKLIPDVFRGSGMEWIYPYMTSALHLRFTLVADIVLYHLHGLDGPTAGFPFRGRHGITDLIYTTMNEMINRKEMNLLGMGIEDIPFYWKLIEPVHRNMDMFDENGFSKCGPELQKYIKQHFFVLPERFDYNKMTNISIDQIIEINPLQLPIKTESPPITDPMIDNKIWNISEILEKNISAATNSNYDIGIVTFRQRFSLLKKLIKSIRRYNKQSNIIINVNGNVNSEFDEKYRTDLYRFSINYPKIFIRIWPEFRSLAKMWNDCIISSTTDNILLLNDDILVMSEEFFKQIEEAIMKYKGLFVINESFSSFVVNKNQIHNLGYFDERLIGFGGEINDIITKYQFIFGKLMPSLTTKYIKHLKSTITQDDYQKSGPKYSLINLVIFNMKKQQKWIDIKQYPYEEFRKLNHSQIAHYDMVKIDVKFLKD